MVSAPDGSQQIHRYASSEGWGPALSTISCAGPFTCHVDPYWDSSNIEAGKDQEEDDYDTTGALLSVHLWGYADNCPPPGVPHSGGSGSDPGGTQLSSELDENNPVVVCDPWVTSEDTYQVNGVTDLNGYQSDSRVVHKQPAYSHDTDDQGVSHYDYGNTNNTDVSGNDLGGAHFVTHATMYPHDDLGNNIYLVNLPAITQVRDASSPPFNAFTCDQSVYGSNSSATTAPNVPDVTQAQSYTAAGCGGDLITVKHSYDASGNAITATDGDIHQGCPAATPTYSACASYDSFAAHLVSATNAKNQTTTYSYDTTAAGGFGEWLTSETDVSGQTKARSVTSYDGLGRSLGSIAYSNATTIVLESSISYTVATGVPGISSDSSTPFERTITLDAYNHQAIGFTDALGRTRCTQEYSGTSSPYTMIRTVGDTYDTLGNTTMVQTYVSTGTVQASYSATYDALKRRTGFNDSDLGSCSDLPLLASCSGNSDFAWKYSYDADGNQLSQLDPRNQGIYTSYDVLDRPLCRGTSSAAVNPCGNGTYAQFFYDSYNNTSNPGVTFPSGCLAPVSPYASDPIGSKTAELFSSSAGSGWRCYGYDQRGKQDQSMLSVTADGTTTNQTMNMSDNDGGELTSLV